MNIMLKRLVTVFGMPDRPDVRAFFEEYARATDGDERTLDMATDILLASYTRSGWPPIGECRAAISKAANRLRPPQPFVAEHEKPLPPPTPEQASKATALVAEFKKNLAGNFVAEKAPAAPLRPDRTAFHHGRLSAVLGGHWQAPSLADSGLVRGLTKISKAMSGERDE